MLVEPIEVIYPQYCTPSPQYRPSQFLNTVLIQNYQGYGAFSSDPNTVFASCAAIILFFLSQLPTVIPESNNTVDRFTIDMDDDNDYDDCR